MKLFGKWSTEVKVSDPGMGEYINLKPLLIPSTGAHHTKKQFWKKKTPIVERLIAKLGVTGHHSMNRKHYFTSGRNTGKKQMHMRFVEKAFEAIEQKTKQNPVQVLVQAIENVAPRAEVTAIEFGGMRHPVPVDVSPQRRVDLALSMIAKGSMKRSIGNKTPYWQILADELMMAAVKDPKSFAIEKKESTERQAEASR